MKIAYGTITLRYVHDVITGEFANVGVVLYAPEQRFFDARFTTSYERLNAMFLKVDHAHFRSLMRYLTNRFEELSLEIRDGLARPTLEHLPDLVRQILPQDDSSLQWSEPGGGLSGDAAKTLTDLYNRFVEKYIPGAAQVSRTDEEIAKPFKAKLGRLSEQLAPKRIETNDYQYEFRFAWKNDVWHLYEPVSFDLLDPNSIREKAIRWYGRSAALRESPEKFKIHFLLGEPRQPGTREAFENARHLLTKIPGDKELVAERDIERIAEHVAGELQSHASSEMVLRDKPKT